MGTTKAFRKFTRRRVLKQENYVIAEKFLAFDEWKTVYHPAWYLNTREQDEQLFEEWLQYKKQIEKNEKAGQ